MLRKLSLLTAASFLVACVASSDESATREREGEGLTKTQRLPRYARIRDAAAARGIRNAYLLAGIANDETGLAHCWSEATWACKGPSSPDCGGGPVIAGSGDGPCDARQGGLGMFQFDAGRYDDTLRVYGSSVLTLDGQIDHAIRYVTKMVRDSAYTTDAETDEKARAWINRFDPNDAALRDQWIKTVVRYYNGCQPGWSCFGDRYRTYSDGLALALDDTGGTAFWNPTSSSTSSRKVLTIQYEVQKQSYWSGPASARHALSARSSPPTQATLASQLGTTTSGTDWVGQITRTLNTNLGEDVYQTVEMPNDPPTTAQRDRLWADLVRSIDANYPVVANIVAPPSNHPPGYPDDKTVYHYFTVIGYDTDTRQVFIADSANFGGNQQYWLRFDQLATLVPPKGYSAAVPHATVPHQKVLTIQYEVQKTGYWCGPASARHALSARMSPPTQATLASQLGTTTAGTDWIGQITRTLNANLGKNVYQTVEMPNDPPTAAQRDRLWADLVRSIDGGYPVVANIVAPPSNHPPGYPNDQTIYHYFTVIGYNTDTRKVFIADSANFGGNQQYWLTFEQLATLIPPKGYTTAAP